MAVAVGGIGQVAVGIVPVAADTVRVAAGKAGIARVRVADSLAAGLAGAAGEHGWRRRRMERLVCTAAGVAGRRRSFP